MLSFVKKWFSKSKIDDAKDVRSLREVIYSLGELIIKLRQELSDTKNIGQVLLGAIILQNNKSISIDNKYIDDMLNDITLYVDVEKTDGKTILKLEKLS